MNKITARKYYSGFELAHDTYNAISAASDGKIYYILSSEDIVIGGQMYCYDPNSDTTKWLADLSSICGEEKGSSISQGKSHVEFYEYQGKLFFSTHVGYYEMINGMERLPVNAPDGMRLYKGGHVLSYDLASGTFEDYGIPIPYEGVLTMSMDLKRGHIYGISWPTGIFFHHDLESKKTYNLGPISKNGEAGEIGIDYRVLCRSILVDSNTGDAYYSTATGDIYIYSPTTHELKKSKKVHLRLDYFGKFDPKDAGSMGYNWRKIFWHPIENVAYGVHGNSGYLFRFDPKISKVEIVDRITSLPSKRSGMNDQFSYGYLGCILGPDKETIYYLTGGPIPSEGMAEASQAISKGGAKALENLHLVTYHLPTHTYKDHGSIFYEDGERPTYVNGIAVGTKNDIYSLARMQIDEKEIADLFKVNI